VTNSISNKLFLILLLCSSVILGIGMTLDYRLSSSAIMEQMRLEAVETIDTAISNLDNLLDGVEGATVFFGNVLQQREYSREELRQMLAVAVRDNEDIYGAAIALDPAFSDDPGGFAAYYYNRDGQLVPVDLAQEQGRYWEREWFARAAAEGRPIWTRPYYDVGGGETWMTTFSVPVYRTDKNGDRLLYAVVTADITLAELHQYMRRLRLGKSGFGVLLSKAGDVLSIRESDNQISNFREILGAEAGPGDWDSIMATLALGGELTRDIDCPDTEESCTVRLGSLRSTGWPVGLIYSEAEVLSPLRDFQIRTAAISLATLLILVLALYLVTSRLTRPLSFLATASSEIARGRMDVPLPRARGNDEVARLVRAFNAMKANLKAYLTDLERATASRSRLEGELAAAREIQMSMLPQGGEATESCAEYGLWARVRPARSVGGDLYSYYRLGNRLFIAAGDVSDKGVPAALFMARAISLIQQAMARGRDPAQAMALLNDALEAGNESCMFVTLFLAELDMENLLLRFASAGHTPPSLLRNGAIHVVPQEDGPALGLAAGLEFPENALQLSAGDRLAVFTDGIDEAFNEQANMFGVERLHEALLGSAGRELGEAGSAVFDAIDAFAGETAQSDDITLMLLQVPLRPGETRRPPGSQSMDFPVGERLASRALDWLETRLEELSLPGSMAKELTLVCEEIVTNIENHGQLAADAVVEFSLDVRADSIAMQLSDPGIAFNPLVEARRSELGADIESAEIGGLGVHLITSFTDRQEYRRVDDRNVLRVTRLLPEDED
jgi:sigma-B regulation protein RsbU (phosphoserine phosphatase)